MIKIISTNGDHWIVRTKREAKRLLHKLRSQSVFIDYRVFYV